MKSDVDMANAYQQVGVIAIVAGLVSHQTFRKYEPTISGFVTVLVLLHTVVYVCYGMRNGYSIADHVNATSLAAAFDAIYLLALGLSILLYRIYFHPLRRFPGPKLSRISKIEWFFRAREGHMYLHMQKMHQKYGPVVRVGPNDLAFSDPQDALIVNGPNSRLEKGPSAEGSPWAKAKSITFVRDRAEHRARRRIWDRGFSTTALRDYEPRIIGLLDQMSNQLASRSGHDIDVAQWASYFAFDAMGDLGFGADFGMVSNGIPHMYSEYIHEALKMRRSWSQIPWCKYLVPYLPMDRKTKEQTRQFVKFGDERFNARKAQGTKRADIFSHLLAQDEESGGRMTEAELKEDARAVIIAGSDTTSFGLTALLFFLVQNPTVYAKVQREVDSLNEKGPAKGTNLGPEQAPFVNGVINETLRLLPPAPDPFQRTTGNSPVSINGKIIPANTCVYASVYSMEHDSSNFTEPEQFMPERWIDSLRPKDPTFNHEIKAFAPFGSGLYNCAGKPLAMLEMRQFCATILHRFEFRKGKLFDENAFMKGLRSNGTMESLTGLKMEVLLRNGKTW